jgi:hypothetical protein
MDEAIVFLAALPLLYLIGGVYYNCLAWLWQSLATAWRQGVASGQAPQSSPSGEIAMVESDAGQFATSGNGPRYDWAAKVSAEIINCHLDSKESKVVLFGKILFIILSAMDRAEEELSWQRLEPSEN